MVLFSGSTSESVGEPLWCLFREALVAIEHGLLSLMGHLFGWGHPVPRLHLTSPLMLPTLNADSILYKESQWKPLITEESECPMNGQVCGMHCFLGR